MSDIDQLLEQAGTDLDRAVRVDAETITVGISRSRRRRVVTVTAALLLVTGLGAAALVALGRSDRQGAAPAGDLVITSELILADGVVTEDEYRAGAAAVVACLAGAGITAEVDFDDPNGHAGFFMPSSAGSAPADRAANLERCLDQHLSDDVSTAWSVTLGQLDLDVVRAEEEATFACVERSSGVDFGEIGYDDFGFLTEEGRRARDAAFEFEDHLPWEACYAELGSDSAGVSFRERQLIERGGLVLTLRGPTTAPCLEVHGERGMSGGCGADLSERLNVSVGGIGTASFLFGWVVDSAETVLVTFADGNVVEIDELVAAADLERSFFLELTPGIGGEPELPISGTALGPNGEVRGEFVLDR